MTDQELKDWRELQKQFENGYHLSKHDWKNLIRLNHQVMELSRNIHNDNMLRKDW